MKIIVPRPQGGRGARRAGWEADMKKSKKQNLKLKHKKSSPDIWTAFLVENIFDYFFKGILLFT
jgi:hypothetical protein